MEPLCTLLQGVEKGKNWRKCVRQWKSYVNCCLREIPGKTSNYCSKVARKWKKKSLARIVRIFAIKKPHFHIIWKEWLFLLSLKNCNLVQHLYYKQRIYHLIIHKCIKLGLTANFGQNRFFSHTFKNKDFILIIFLFNHKSFTEKKNVHSIREHGHHGGLLKITFWRGNCR